MTLSALKKKKNKQVFKEVQWKGGRKWGSVLREIWNQKKGLWFFFSRRKEFHHLCSPLESTRKQERDSAIGIFIQNQAAQNLVPIPEPGTKTQVRGKENCPQLDEHQSRTWGTNPSNTGSFQLASQRVWLKSRERSWKECLLLCGPHGVTYDCFYSSVPLRLEAWPLALTLEPRKPGLVLTADYLQVPAVQTGSCQYIHKEWTEREWRGKPFFSQIRFNYPSPKSLPSVVPAN